MSAYLIGSILMALVCIGGVVLAYQLAKPNPRRSRFRGSDVAAIFGLALLAYVAVFAQVPAAAQAGDVRKAISGVVYDTNGTNPVVLTIETDAGKYDIPCGVEQKACQIARKGDLVQFDTTNSPSGWGDPTREIRFVTLGANSQPR